MAVQPDSALATPAAAVRDSILTLVPAAVWWLLVYVLGIGRETALLIGGVLAIWPVVAFVLLPGPPACCSAMPAKGWRSGSASTAACAGPWCSAASWPALVILTSTLPLTPALADLVHRCGMICVLLIALPGLQLRSLILTHGRRPLARRPGLAPGGPS